MFKLLLGATLLFSMTGLGEEIRTLKLERFDKRAYAQPKISMKAEKSDLEKCGERYKVSSTNKYAFEFKDDGELCTFFRGNLGKNLSAAAKQAKMDEAKLKDILNKYLHDPDFTIVETMTFSEKLRQIDFKYDDFKDFQNRRHDGEFEHIVDGNK